MYFQELYSVYAALTGKYPTNKHDLLSYLKILDLNNSSSLEEKAEEIVKYVKNGLKAQTTIDVPTAMWDLFFGKRGCTIQDYYKLCIEKIEEAYKLKDSNKGLFHKQFPEAIEFVKMSIEQE